MKGFRNNLIELRSLQRIRKSSYSFDFSDVTFSIVAEVTLSFLKKNKFDIGSAYWIVGWLPNVAISHENSLITPSAEPDHQLKPHLLVQEHLKGRTCFRTVVVKITIILTKIRFICREKDKMSFYLCMGNMAIMNCQLTYNKFPIRSQFI